ncbi:MAG: FtsW/RodA/SpoVE family cell cycle protein [Oliverpabstia sp.]|nr:FtsW/RodA/SpoVE family cell cycle protein [Oliverpabstia sp.]
MKTVITEISKYLIIFTMIIFTFQCFTIFRKHDQEDKNQVLRRQIILMLFMNFIAYAVLYLQTEDIKMLVMYVSVLAFILLVQLLYRVIYKKGNLLIVNNMCMLLSIGFLILSRLKFDKAIKQFQIVVLSMALSFIVPVIVRKVKLLKDLTWLYGIVGIGLLGVVLVLATISGGAKLSIEIGGITFQFSELVKITFVFFVAGMLREDQSFKRVVITTVVAALHVLILVLSKDLGSALVFFVAYIVMLYVATKKPLYALAGLAAGCLAAVAAYFMFNHVRQRVIAWKDPIAVYDQIGGGYQLAQGLFGISAGGWFGMGLGQGMPTIIPVVDKDFIFAAICEELGAIFAICMLLVCMSCYLMIVNVSMKMSKPFYKLIAMGLGAEYAFQVFLTVGGSSKFIPLTGITLPLVSYGGSSVICSIMMFAIIQGLYILREDEGEELERQRRERQKEKRRKKKNGSGGYGMGSHPQREKTLEEKIEEQTEKSLNW